MSEREPRPLVLLVDDEDEFRLTTSKLLERRGFRVVAAGSGEMALALLATREVPDVVVLDVKMPGIGGEGVFAAIRKRHSTVPVIFLTGHGSVPEAFQRSKEGAWDYLVKPCDIEHLVNSIRAACAPALATDATSTGDDGSVSVLLVDDEEELRESLRRVLARRHLVVQTAPGGLEALAALRTADFDVVVLDLRMPGMDGFEALRRIKQEFPDREVILLTGHPTAENAAEGVRAGAFQFLAKPPDIAALGELIRHAAARRRATRRVQQEHQVREILERQPE